MSRGGTKIKPPFQFTPLREGRHILRRVLRAAGISIHAPPRGATESAATGSAEQEFQFTPLREGRQRYEVTDAASGEFQFTPLREGRPRALLVARKLHLFQFTPLREGRRKAC